MDTFANSVDPDEMQHSAAFHQGLHCFLRFKTFQPSGTAIHHNLKNFTNCICMGKSIRLLSVKM